VRAVIQRDGHLASLFAKMPAARPSLPGRSPTISSSTIARLTSRPGMDIFHLEKRDEAVKPTPRLLKGLLRAAVEFEYALSPQLAQADRLADCLSASPEFTEVEWHNAAVSR
jgi:hypothetical protein